MSEQPKVKKTVQEIGNELLTELDRKKNEDLLIHRGMIAGIELYWKKIVEEHAPAGWEQPAGKEETNEQQDSKPAS